MGGWSGWGGWGGVGGGVGGWVDVPFVGLAKGPFAAPVVFPLLCLPGVLVLGEVAAFVGTFHCFLGSVGGLMLLAEG